MSWGCYKATVLPHTRELFEVRPRDADDVIDVLLENYHRLPDDIKAELSVNRVWTLALEKE